MAKTGKRKRSRPRRRRQRGGKFDFQKAIEKTGIEFHLPGYNFAGPGTKLAKRLKRGDKGINRLDDIALHHDIAYSKAKNLQDKWKAETFHPDPGEYKLRDSLTLNWLASLFA